jgi:hypothetical protein
MTHGEGAAAPTLPDIVAEGRRVLATGSAARLPIRLLGGVSFHIRARGKAPSSLERAYGDIDLICAPGSTRTIAALLEGLGYVGDRQFNAVNGNRRLLFRDESRGRQLDVFVGTFEMCHEIPVADRLEVEEETIPAAELLLTKLQIVNVNDKDQRDAASLLLTHEITHRDGTGMVNAGVVAELLGADWGLWRTSRMNVERLRDRSDALGLDSTQRQALLSQLDELWHVVEGYPRSRAWRLRARIGDKKRWYQQPDEVE